MDNQTVAKKRSLFSDLNDGSQATIEDVLEHLQAWRTETLETVDLLRTERQQIEERANLLENPKAAYEYLDFFLEFLGRIAADLDRVCQEQASGIVSDHPGLLRQIASNAALEQRRCLVFRDKYINKPLPHEVMRPLLNQISIDTRDQLLDYRGLNFVAARLAALAGETPKPSAPDPGIDRRSLFTKFLPRTERE